MPASTRQLNAFPFAVLSFLLIGACTRPPTALQPLPQRAYVWQRQWNSAVSDAITLASRQLDGLVVLGAEFDWKGSSPYMVETNIDWDALHSVNCGLPIRVGPTDNSGTIEDLPVEKVRAEVGRLVSEAEAHQVALTELQLDFDCPVKQLGAYQKCVGKLRTNVRPLALGV